MPIKTSRTSKAPAAKKKRRSVIHRGEEGMARVDNELAKAKAKREARQATNDQPFRYRLKPGEEGQIVILDESPTCFLYEHNMKNPATGYYDLNVPCVAEYDTCPVCETPGEKDAYYAMMLTVIDLRGYKAKSGEEVEFSRKLFVVKPASQKRFIRRFKKNGSLRGEIVNLSRDGDKDPVIGNDVEWAEEAYSEDELAEFQREWTDRTGKAHTEDCSAPYDYDALFPEPDVEELRAMMGGKPPAGSRREAKEELDSDDGWDDKEETEADGTPWDAEEEDEEKTTSTARPGKKKVSKKGATPRRRPVAVDDDEDEEEAEEVEEKPARLTRRPPPPGRATANTRADPPARRTKVTRGRRPL